MKLHNNVINNFCQFHPLKEIWIGGCYPGEYFEQFDSKTRDIFQHISDITQKDFDNLELVFKKFNVNVRRPKFESIDYYLDDEDRLLKPPITPCDFAVVINDTLYVIPQYPSGIEPFQNAINDYLDNKQKVIILNRGNPDPMCWLSFASLVKIGRDVYIDYVKGPSDSYVLQVIDELAKDHRVHVSNTGDHSDAVFCPIKTGELISTFYRKNYTQTFPQWNAYQLNRIPNVNKYQTEQKWSLPNVDYMYFNENILKIANSWIGYIPETIFEINMVVIDEKNIICCAENDQAFRYFESIGVTPHLVKFQSKEFWDAGLHCLTRDIHRAGVQTDYWPDRGPNGIYPITEW
jgi:hypothetical protein